MYKVTKFVFEMSIDKAFRLRKYVTIKDGLTLTEAKQMRREDRDLQIVKLSK